LLPHPPVRECPDQADGQDGYGNAGDRHRHRSRRQRKRADASSRIGHDFDGAHRGEMVRGDREREHESRNQGCAQVIATHRDRQRHHAEQHAENDRGQDQSRNPGDMSGNWIAHMPL
jgi:hypothetical protein